ncbi:hypothetical protein DYB35_013977 [Aphanomyces astaci]|uniref:Carboxypeptidase n=1 Tax=Aphanomyces astaci TaxID=112090 RepID=A0A418DGZ4_APHAT|nr:hypothetical protein DYB35_013977 [Aphanomyces astaci]
MVAYVASCRPTIPWSRELTPTFCDTTYHESGYIKLPHKANDQYFYWYFESRSNPTDDPSYYGNSTQFNAHSWTNHANMIWLDQRTGVGFSFSGGRDDDHIEVDVGRNVYEFLLGFFQAHPKLQAKPFYIAGQSYGGHYVPAVAAYILQTQDANTTAFRINLQGITIGNGLTDTVTQYPLLVNMVVENSYNITLVSCGPMSTAQPDSGVLDTYDYWDANLCEPMITNPTRNPYDFRQLCEPDVYDDLGVVKTTLFLNQPWVQQQLHVHKPYAMSNATVLEDFAVDEERNAVHFVASILARGLRELIYAGDADLICDWKGNDAWTRKLQWSGHDGFNAANVTPFVVNGNVAGTVQAANELAFVRVFNSGHCVPRDQPAVSAALINRFLQNETL